MPWLPLLLAVGTAHSPSVDGPASAAASALERGNFNAAAALPARDPEERAWILAQVALAEGRLSDAAAAATRVNGERGAELAWRIAHARRDPPAIAETALRYCAHAEPTGRACVDAELYAAPIPSVDVQLPADVEVAMIGSAPFPLVVAELGGARTGVIVDSGASQTVISTRLADELGLRTTSRGFPVGVAAGSGMVLARLAVLPELRVGAATVRHLPVLVVDLPELDEKGVSLILSPQQAFAGLVVTLDFARDRMALRRSVLADDLLFGHATPYYEVGFDLAVPARVGGGDPALFGLDTGMSGEFALTRRFAVDERANGRQHLNGAGQANELETVPPRPVEIGGAQLHSRQGGLLTDMQRPGGIQLAGLLGNGLWPDATLSIDTRGRRVILRMPDVGPPLPTPAVRPLAPAVSDGEGTRG